MGKLIFFLHLLSLTRPALRCRMWIWSPFLWLIPQDPQPFPAAHRKPHALCITTQAYFRAEKQKIERNTEFTRLPQSVPQLLMFLWKTRSRSNCTELPRGKHEIFSIVIPFFPSLLSSSNFLREKSPWKSERWQRAYSMFSSYDYLDASFQGGLCEETARLIGGG